MKVESEEHERKPLVVLMTHLMNGIEVRSLEDYPVIWMESSTLSGTIYKGVIQLVQEIKLISNLLYN